MVSCRTGPGTGGAAGFETPSYEALVHGHNSRVDRIGEVYARGVIELWWTDDDGRHHEQGEADLWVAPPRRTALNIAKLGRRLMWIGSDDDTAWFFDFRQDATTLYIAAGGELAATSAVPFDPTLLLDLGGLTRLPASGGNVRYDDDRDAWVVTARDHPRLFLDRETLLPVRSELLDEEGRILLYSAMKLSRYERIEITGASPLAGPRFPTLVDIVSTDGRIKVRLSVRGPTGGDVAPRYFDLRWLTDRFKPVTESRPG